MDVNFEGDPIGPSTRRNCPPYPFTLPPCLYPLTAFFFSNLKFLTGSLHLKQVYLVQPLWKTVWRFLKKLEIELPYDPAIPLLGIHTKETRSERDTCTPMFIAAPFIIVRTWKQPRCPSADKWIRKL